VAEASAPASSANLGPGFDCLALALDLRCTVRANRSSGWSVRHTGNHAPDPDHDAVLVAARAAVGEDRPLALEVRSDIPLGRGLGSSAAAFTAGAAAAWRAVGEHAGADRVYPLVAGLEAHPDNAAAAVYGGFVLVGAAGTVHRLAVPDALAVVLVIPGRPLSTAEARTVLPDRIDRAVAVRSLARVAALMAGLLTVDDGLLDAAGGDEIHEAPRAGLRPEVADWIEAAREAGALHAAWSGAGPSMIAFVRRPSVGAVSEALRNRVADEAEVVVPGIADQGLC
jgi:homoserine kinase